MNAPAGLDLTSIPDRIQSEVQRAIQRSIKGVEYFASSGPALGSTPKDILHTRGTMNLYHYRPLADEIYRVPILIVMATTNRGYILDMVPGQSFIEFLLKRGYDVYMLDWTAPKPEEKSLRMEDYVLDFIPDCVRRVQRDSGETDVTVIGYCFGGVLSLLYGSIFANGPMKNLICFTTPVDFREMKLFRNFSDRRYFDVDRLVDSVGNVPPEMILSSFEMLRPASRAASQVQLWENIWNDEFVKSYRMFDRWATDTLPLAGEYFRQTIKELMWDNKIYNGTMSVGGRPVDDMLELSRHRDGTRNRLETPPVAARADHAVGPDTDVSDLPGGAAGAAVGLAGEDEPRADTGREPDVDHVVDALTSAEDVLAESSGVGVVGQLDRNTEPFAHLGRREDSLPARKDAVRADLVGCSGRQDRVRAFGTPLREDEPDQPDGRQDDRHEQVEP